MPAKWITEPPLEDVIPGPCWQHHFLGGDCKGSEFTPGWKKKAAKEQKQNKTKSYPVALGSLGNEYTQSTFLFHLWRVKDRAQHGAEGMPWQWYPTGAEHVESDSPWARVTTPSPAPASGVPVLRPVPPRWDASTLLGWLVWGGKVESATGNKKSRIHIRVSLNSALGPNPSQYLLYEFCGHCYAHSLSHPKSPVHKD